MRDALIAILIFGGVAAIMFWFAAGGPTCVRETITIPDTPVERTYVITEGGHVHVVKRNEFDGEHTHTVCAIGKRAE